MQPIRFQISAQYAHKLSKDKTLHIQFFQEKDHIQTNLRTGTSDLILKDSEIEEAYKFINESLAAFKQLVTVNNAFVSAQPTKVEK